MASSFIEMQSKNIDLVFNGSLWNGSDVGEAHQWNLTKEFQDITDIPIDANFAWLVFSLLIAMIWFTYITHYSSRVTGQIFTRLLNHFFVKNGYLRIGSLTWDALAGKIMFRDIVFTTEDFSLRIQDGWLVFRWWRSYVPRDISEDLSHSDTRLSLLLNGLELHVYNRSQLYNQLERLFGLESLIIPDEGKNSGKNSTSKSDSPEKDISNEEPSEWGSKNILGRSWRDLIPVIKIEICCGRLVFGNRLVPTTLCLSMEEGHMVYSTKPAMSKLDHFMHVVNCRAENFKVTLAPSLKYTGMNDEPPRLMGEGFVILSSNTIDFYYYMDEPGLVPEVPLMIELANGDVVECHAPPAWGLDIRCGKGTDFSYGPWADRKREQLFKFFYPPNYQPMQVTALPRPGEKRAAQSFDIRFSTLAEATVDILFSKCKETNAVHMTIGAGSYLEITIPWVTKSDGYVTKISGQLLHVEGSTSLQYRSLLEAETLKFSVMMHYPIAWNSHQSWNLNLTATKATLHVIYEHRYFFQDLINDWSSRNPADLLHHVPYTWFLTFCLKEFELVTVANQYNWVDCSSQHQENAYAAFSGKFLELAFNLPFTDFLPPTLALHFRIRGETLDMNMQLPDMSTNRPVLLALSTHARTSNRNVMRDRDDTIDCDSHCWRNFVKRSDGWVQCWKVPVLSLTIQYTYHPMTPAGPPPQANVPTPEKEELLLTPVRFPAPASSSLRVPHKIVRQPAIEFDVTSLNPDEVNVQLELGPSELFVYGTVLRMFLHLKENIFGEDQRMADMADTRFTQTDLTACKNPEASLNHSADPIPETLISVEESAVDVRIGRPLHVFVSITMNDIHAHLMKHCSKDDPSCPSVSLEKLSFEMHKTFLETKLQLLLSPAILYSTDVLLRSAESSHLQQGFLVLSALQVRGHAMFSPTGRAIDEETVEYAWMIEAVLGQLTGRLTLPQLQNVVAGLESFLHLALDDENQLTRPPKNPTRCHHDNIQVQCPSSTHNTVDPSLLVALCPSSEDIKYRMTRFSADLIDITLVETGSAIGIQIYPIRLATCNLHSRLIYSGVSLLVPSVSLRQYLSTSRGPAIDSSFTALNAVGRYQSEVIKISSSNSTWNRTQASGHSPSVEELYIGVSGDIGEKNGFRQSSPTTSHRIDGCLPDSVPAFRCQEWLEVGLVEMGPFYVDVGSSVTANRHDYPQLQSAFLKLHDTRTRRLWFLWNSISDRDPNDVISAEPAKCGCRGGCAFFGQNANGHRFFERETDSMSSASEGSGACYLALANSQLRRGNDPVFAQSILRDNAFLIDVGGVDEATEDSILPETSIAAPVTNESERTASDSRSERPLSQNSNTSTVKNVALVSLQAKAEEAAYKEEEATRDVFIRKSRSSRISLQEVQQENERYQRLGSATSTPTLLPTRFVSSTSNGKRKGNVRVSMPLLADVELSTCDIGNSSSTESTPATQVLPAVRKHSNVSSRASRSESQSELYYSAEEDDDDNTSSNDELVSLSPSPSIDGITNYNGANDTAASTVVTPTNRTRTSTRLSRSEALSSSSSPTTTSSTSNGRSSRTSRTSNISFNSAISSVDDFSLVDLHLQSARPVVESPILLASYITHLGEAQCDNWKESAPKFPADLRSSVSSRPRFTLVKSGFSSFRLVDRSPPISTPGFNTRPQNHNNKNSNSSANIKHGPSFFSTQSAESKTGVQPPWTWDSNSNDDDRSKRAGADGPDMDSSVRSSMDDMSSDASTVLVVKIGRPIHVMCCPLTLESTQRFVEALVPTLEHLHPMTLMTRVWMGCVSHVESQNPLKKQRAALLEHKEAGQGTGQGLIQVQAQSLYRDSIEFKLRGSVQIPRINVCALQAGIVEQVISLSALDNPRDLVCVSAVAVCFDSLSLHFSQSVRQCRMVQTISRPPEQRSNGAISSAGTNKNPFGAYVTKTKSRPGNATGSPGLVFVEWSRIEDEQLMVSGTLGKIHLQLRRLSNESPAGTSAPPALNITTGTGTGTVPGPQAADKVFATVIPTGCSRVLFSFADERLSGMESEQQGPSSPSQSDEDKYGSVMFECGLQGLDLRAVKRVSAAPCCSGQGMEMEENISSSTLVDVEMHATATGQTTTSFDGARICTENENQGSAPDTAVGSVPSHSSQMSFKQRPEKSEVHILRDHYNKIPPSHHSAVDGRIGGGNSVQVVNNTGDKDLSSCSLQIKGVWLSFAAPPRTTVSNKKSSESALLDRNLLSTASPGIDAWMNSSDRLTITLLQLLRVTETRSLSVLAGLMAEALDVQQIHLPVKSKYNCLSLMSRTLQEDPSCQLNAVLHRYVLMLRYDWATLEARLSPAVVPPLSTLKQGVVVLSRQWKNAIYTPLMLTYSLHHTHGTKMKMGYNGTPIPTPAAAPAPFVSPFLAATAQNKDLPSTAEVRRIAKKLVNPEPGNDDERTALLLTNGGEAESSWLSSDESSLVLNATDLNDSILPLLSGRNSTSQSSSPHKVITLKRKMKRGGHNLKHPPSLIELKTISTSSADEENEEEDLSSPTKVPRVPLLRTADNKDEDLYNWMARQQKSTAGSTAYVPDRPNFNEFASSQTNFQHQQPQTHPFQQQQQKQQQPNLLVDTHAIFASLFASVFGLEKKRSLSELLSLSGSASVLGGIEELRVEIFESEWSQSGGTSSSKRSKNRGNGANPNGGRMKNATGSGSTAPGSGSASASGSGGPKFSVYIPPEVPAFLCERMAIEIQVNQISDGGEGLTVTFADGPVPPDDETHGGAAFLGLWKPRRTTALNFSLSVGYLAQQVNMPLLRLLHQLSSVYMNAKTTQVQLREQRPLKRAADPLRVLDAMFDSSESTPSPVNAPLPQQQETQQKQQHQEPLDKEPKPQQQQQLHRSHPVRPQPSPSTLSESFHFASRSFRPSSFLSQRLRSGSRLLKGYDAGGLEDPLLVPIEFIEPGTAELEGREAGPGGNVGVTSGVPISAQFESMPKCWRTIYHLLDLYASMTAASTINKQHINLIDHPTDETDHLQLPQSDRPSHHTRFGKKAFLETGAVSSDAGRTRTRLVVFGIMKISRVRLLAMLSGLRLESEIVSLHSSLTYKEKVPSATTATIPTLAASPAPQAHPPNISRPNVQPVSSDQQQQDKLKQKQTSIIPRVECSMTGHLGRAMIVLLEGVAPSQQTVVKITVGKSQALYSRLTASRQAKDKNSGLLSIGAVLIDIPQHPGVLHGMMTRGSKQLSSTLQEFRVPRLASRAGRNTSTIPDEGDTTTGANTSGSVGFQQTSHLLHSPPKETPLPQGASQEYRSPTVAAPETNANFIGATGGGGVGIGRSNERQANHLLQPLVMQFSIVLQRLSVTAALLPSLQAQYQMEQVVSAGITGGKAKFDIDLPRHSLSFTTKLQITENLPPSASIELPQVHVTAEYLQDSTSRTAEEFVDGVVLCRGNYLSAVAEIGTFEHCLTTDLLNHLVFVQKVFMTEVNDVLNKVSGSDKPVPLWEDWPGEGQHDDSSSALRMLLYNLIVRLKGIQITATTPTNTAVRLETGLVELQLSNRVQNVANSSVGRTFPSSTSGRSAKGNSATSASARPRTSHGIWAHPPTTQTPVASHPTATSTAAHSQPAKVFGQAKVDLNLSLGQLIRNPLFEEAEAEFQQVAFFKTRISLRNAFQDELTPIETGDNDAAADKEVVLITLTRPLIYLQPVAVDKAILVWLNYKNAYDYWTEQRGGWINEADKLDKLGQLTSQLGVGTPSLGTLFLQLTVDDMGICMPLNTQQVISGGGNSMGGGNSGGKGPGPGSCSDGEGGGGNRHASEPETCSAVVVTLENSSISACSSGSLVSKGKFTGLCLRFADDFETGLDDWKPDMDDPTIMNLCVVSEGTYEVCSRTVTPTHNNASLAAMAPPVTENAKWILHIGWQMEGVDTHFDTSIGKQFTALGRTLTGLTGGEEGDEDEDIEEELDDDVEENEEACDVGTEDHNSKDSTKQQDGGTGNKVSMESVLASQQNLNKCASSSEDENEAASAVGGAGSTSDVVDCGEQVELRRKRGRCERALTVSEIVTAPRGRRRSRLIEKEMSEQARIIQDLRSLGASSATVEQEMRRLQELEAQASKDFRREMLQRLKRQSVKASSIKDNLGLGGAGGSDLSTPSAVGATTRPSSLHHTQSQRLPSHGHAYHQRSKSVVVPPVLVDWDESEPNSGVSSGSTDDVIFTNTAPAPRLTLPTIEGSPPMSCLATPTSNEGHRIGRRPRTPSSSTASMAVAGTGTPLDRDRVGTENAGGGVGANKISSEPSIDLELDFKVFINSGKCVLHTRDTRNDELARRMKKERSFSSTVLDATTSASATSIAPVSGGTKDHHSSPLSARKHMAAASGAGVRGDIRQNASTSRLRVLAAAANTAQMAVDLTIFHIPGLDVKVYYESKTVHEDITFTSNTSSPASSISGKSGKLSTKKGSLFAWMTLHSIPEETIISPHILEFLEQALEPIPIPESTKPQHHQSSSAATAAAATAAASSADNSSGLFQFDGTTATGTSAGSTAASFPVDVVVYCHVQPSTFRFSCLPVSRVECLLRLPSLHLVFSSKRSENHQSTITAGSTAGGLSVTGCLSDFSLYIFHPYGGGKKTTGSTSTANKRESVDGAESERKDSLSVNVEFVKFNLSRSRKVSFFGLKTGGCNVDGAGASRNGRDSAGDPAKAVVRFSTLIDIGSASFKYDMRRLPEILAFPKAWYRRTIVRHLFLGDLSKTTPATEPSAGRDLWAELQPDQTGLSPSSAWETLVVFAVNFTRLNVHMNMGNVCGNVSWLTKDFKAEGRLSIGSTGHKNMYIGVGLEGSGLDAKGGIVGGTIELSGIHTSLAIREDPGTEPDHRMAVKLQVLECRLDYMGTSVLMGRVSDLAVDLRDEWRVGNLIKTERLPTRRTSLASSSPTKRPAMIFIHGDLGWDQLQLMISKSTTADLIKMYLKLDEFFQQQFRSSRRIFSTLSATSIRRKGPARTTVAVAAAARAAAASGTEPLPVVEAQHHRHWQEVLRRVAGLQVTTLPTPLPQTGSILGGTMELHGGHISLACFHGVNFKSKSWALFSLKDPCVSFATEAQEIPGEDLKDIHVVQNLSFSLGLTSPDSNAPVAYRVIEQQQQHSPASMATVCRISRTQLFPPQFKTLQDWFLYAFANSRLDAMEKFPSLERKNELERSNMASQILPVKTPDYNHTAEIIFAFPSLQLHLKSEHLQTGTIPLLIGDKPNVDCSFITDFEDHIFVTVDAEAFFFLHDLISSYVREKERVILATVTSNLRTQSPELNKTTTTNGATSGSSVSDSVTSPTLNSPLTLMVNDEEKKRRILEHIDWRNYECKTWHLEPTVRLLSWAGKRIEPYGVEYILNKLGFSQARTTIPKWVQRGAMDPLDKILSVVLSHTIAAQRAKESNTTKR